jgi:hypothetical protein
VHPLTPHASQPTEGFRPCLVDDENIGGVARGEGLGVVIYLYRGNNGVSMEYFEVRLLICKCHVFVNL